MHTNKQINKSKSKSKSKSINTEKQLISMFNG